jgi:hypothetical protein
MTKRCSHFGRPAAYKAGWLFHRRVLALSLEGELQEDEFYVEGSSKANFFAWQ